MNVSLRLRSKHRRSGWQLIELSMVLAVLAMISVAATRAIIALMAIENRSGQALQDADVLARLGQAWRTDLHRSRAANLSNDGESLELQQPAGVNVRYRIKGSELMREQSAPAQRLTSRESFAASARSWRFETADEGRLYAVVRESAPLSLTGHGSGVSPSVVDRIEGALSTLPIPESASGKGGTP
ncbi:MAG TPA: hypothetical protein VM510_15365 [Caulifigura sp.]|jgi:hypothetical protein|nr:hypothetical protein [Caulifigura sp.]